MTISSSSSKPRRGLAISSIVAGAVATLMIIGFWLIGGSLRYAGPLECHGDRGSFFYAS